VAGDLAFEWRRRISENSDLRINCSYDRIDRPEIGFSKAAYDTGDFQVQYHFTAHNQDISVGLGDRTVSETVVGEGLATFTPSTMEYQTGSAFAQDEIHLFGERLLLTAGVKVEYDVHNGRQTQPTARALWAPNNKHSAWVSASRAVRTPTFYERTANVEMAAMPASPESWGAALVYSVVGSSTLQSEVSKDYELGYRAQLSPNLSIDLAGFYTHYDGLRTITPALPILSGGAQPYLTLPFIFTNLASARTQGGEVAVTYHPVTRLKFAASYSYEGMHEFMNYTMSSETRPSTWLEAPAHQLKLQSYWNISKSVQLDTHLFYSTSYLAAYGVVGAQIAEHLRADVRLSWQVRPAWELSLVGHDLGAHSLLELTSEAFSPASYTGRDFFLKTTWRF